MIVLRDVRDQLNGGTVPRLFRACDACEVLFDVDPDGKEATRPAITVAGDPAAHLCHECYKRALVWAAKQSLAVEQV